MTRLTNNITDENVLFIMNRLNNRPKKTFGYKTTNEVFIGADSKRLHDAEIVQEWAF